MKFIALTLFVLAIVAYVVIAAPVPQLPPQAQSALSAGSSPQNSSPLSSFMGGSSPNAKGSGSGKKPAKSESDEEEEEEEEEEDEDDKKKKKGKGKDKKGKGKDKKKGKKSKDEDEDDAPMKKMGRSFGMS